MAKKSTSSSSPTPNATPVSSPVSSTAVRNTAMPPRTSAPPSSPRKSGPTQEQIARRAYEIWQSGKGGSKEENWYRAERELRGY